MNANTREFLTTDGHGLTRMGAERGSVTRRTGACRDALRITDPRSALYPCLSAFIRGLFSEGSQL